MFDANVPKYRMRKFRFRKAAWAVPANGTSPSTSASSICSRANDVELRLVPFQHAATLSRRLLSEVRGLADHVLRTETARARRRSHPARRAARRRCVGRASAPGPAKSARVRPTCAAATSGTPGVRRTDGRSPRRIPRPQLRVVERGVTGHHRGGRDAVGPQLDGRG